MQRLLMFSLILLVTQISFGQSTVVLNNNMGAPANYRTLQGALDSVEAGTTILMQGSGKNYGYGNITKPVVIYGAGYFLGQNNPPSTQAIQSESQLEGLGFSPGSQGSIISGLSFFASSLNNGNGNRIGISGTNNISISRCRMQVLGCGSQGCRALGIVIQNSSNVNIDQCYMTIDAASLLYLNSASGINLKNNIIIGNPILTLLSDISISPYTYTYTNNSMYGKIEYTQFANGNFVNNVIINTSATTVVASNMTYADHNVSNANIFPGGTNITTADGPSTYVLNTNPGISSTDGIWQLKPGSVAIGYGNDSKDAGAYGGNVPYAFSGIPAIPNIFFANPQQVGTTNGGLKIQLKIKANN